MNGKVHDCNALDDVDELIAKLDHYEKKFATMSEQYFLDLIKDEMEKKDE